MVENKPVSRSEVLIRQAEEKAQRRQLILDAALIVFAAKGYAETSMVDIALAARLGKATLYYYFPTKEAIYEAIYVSGTVAYYSEMMPVLENEQPNQLIKTMLTFYVEYMSNHRDFFQLFFPLGRSAPTQLIESQAIRELLTWHRQQLDTIMQSKLQVIQPGQLEHMLQVLWTFLMGLNSKLLRHVPMKNLMDEIDTINRFMLQFLKE